MGRIVVTGYMIRYPVAGNILAFFQYVLGLHRLGHDVLYVEESGWPGSCYDPMKHDYSNDPGAGLSIVRTLMREHGMRTPVCFVNSTSGEIAGADWGDLKRMLREADLLLNVGGVCWFPELQLCRRRALIDMDPFFTQVGRFGGSIEHFHTHFSYGTNIGRPECRIPTLGVGWVPTVPPVIPELWQSLTRSRIKDAGISRPGDGAFTTIANWSAYGTLTYRGQHYGQKDEEFLRLIDLPRLTPQRMELALSGAGIKVTSSLSKAGWSIRNADEVSTTVRAYQGYIANSRGEFSAAKNAYVKTHSGWFSDRSVCYLAAGRPVILQDTGFSNCIPAGWGVMAFSSLDEAVVCVEKVNAQYQAHSRAARKVAEKVFNYKVVLPTVLRIAL